MTSIPHLAHTLQTLFTTVAATAGRTTAFIQRASKLTGATFVQTLVFAWLADPEATYEDLAQTATLLGAPVTPQAIAQRFTPQAAACLHQVLDAAIGQLIAGDPVATPLLARFSAWAVQDSTTITLPAALTDHWAGCGTGLAGLKLHVRWDLCTGALVGPQLTAARVPDQASPPALDLPPGSLWLGDLGYFDLSRFAALTDRQIGWLVRFRSGTVVTTDSGYRGRLPGLLGDCPAPVVDLPLRVGEAGALAARLIAVRVPQEVVDQRRRRMQAEAKRRGRAVSAETLALAAWTILLTNVEPDQLTVDEALVAARSRWQIELLFKLWKSHGRIDESRSGKPWRILCEVYAKVLAMLVQHWMLLVSCWTYADRSLPKAAQTVRRLATVVAVGLTEPSHVDAALTRLARCIGQGCRINKRKTTCHWYQLAEACVLDDFA